MQEKTDVDLQIKKNRQEFIRGFRRGMKISVSIYSILILFQSTIAANASDIPHQAPDRDLVPVNPIPVGLVPIPKPGMKPLSATTKGAFVGGASSICTAAIQSGDFLLGFGCAMLFVIAGILMNRPD